MLKTLFLVGAGGFIGSIARYLVYIAVPMQLAGVPVPTLVVNVVGSFAIGLLLGWGETRVGSDLWRFLVVGCLGGFTTFSTLSAETLMLAKSDRIGSFFLTILAHVVLGIAAAGLGYAMTRL